MIKDSGFLLYLQQTEDGVFTLHNMNESFKIAKYVLRVKPFIYFNGKSSICPMTQLSGVLDSCAGYSFLMEIYSMEHGQRQYISTCVGLKIKIEQMIKLEII